MEKQFSADEVAILIRARKIIKEKLGIRGYFNIQLHTVEINL